MEKTVEKDNTPKTVSKEEFDKTIDQANRYIAELLSQLKAADNQINSLHKDKSYLQEYIEILKKQISVKDAK